MAKPTASESRTNSARAAPCMKNEGMNTAMTQSIASRRGTAVCWLPRRTDRATERVPSIWWWMFSTSTVDSSTRILIAKASPPTVMMLIVCPVSQSPKSAPQSANGMFRTTITLRQSRSKRSTISPVRPAPISPSVTTVHTDLVTVGDGSSSKPTALLARAFDSRAVKTMPATAQTMPETTNSQKRIRRSLMRLRSCLDA